ncbi:hypothetical protein [Lewinella sp. LCG006]|uniref:hypothetical protein n=1 Tax=Lewinella sp. LCG006 TaxID=3231911 RepID=UPI00346165CA
MLRQLFYNKVGIVLLLTIVLSIAIFIYANDLGDTSKEIALAIASSLFATAIFTVFYNVFTFQTTSSILDDSIGQQLQNSKDEIVQSVKAYYKEYVPDRIFEGSNAPAKAFGQDLIKEIQATDTYSFRGISGKRTAIRIELVRGKLTEVRLNLINPADQNALVERANLMLSIDQMPQTLENVEKVVTRIKKDVFSCLAGLYYYGKTKCQTIVVAFQNGTSTSRLELLDDAIYISLYDDGYQRYPETLKFSRETKIYRLYQLEFQKEFKQISARSSITISSNTSEEEFIQQLSSLGVLNDISIETIKIYRDEYERLRSLYINKNDLYSLT